MAQAKQSIRGSCLCGGVKYEITGLLEGAANCHCSMCRKQHGAAFRSRAGIKASDFHWIQGEGLVTFYESSPGTHRGFCSVCGSPICNRIEAKAVSGGGVARVGVQLGGLDDDPGVTPGAHVFVADKAPWFTITDDLPQFAQFPAKATSRK
jgi:hypothetical protein